METFYIFYITEILRSLCMFAILCYVLLRVVGIYAKNIADYSAQQARLTQIISEAISLNTSVLSRLERSMEILSIQLGSKEDKEWWQTPKKEDTSVL